MSFKGGLSVSDFLKEGTKHLSGVDEVVLRNIEAVKKLAQIVRTSMGPNGMNKMLINHLERLFVTHDAATITKELEVVHPAAKMVVLAAQSQEQEIGDATNLVITLAGELLTQAEQLLRMGLHTSDIIEGYKKGVKKALEILDGSAVMTVDNLKDVDQVTRALTACISSKQHGYESLLAPLVARACINACPKNPKFFNVDNVRTAKIEGASVNDTQLLNGLVLVREANGTVKHITNAKIAVFGCSVDASATETKGTVLIHNADELMNYNLSEETAMEKAIKEVADTGVNVIVSGGSFGEMAMHFIERYGMMAVRIPSKFDLRRLCKAVEATALVRIGAPTPEEIGHCDVATVEEIGGTKVCIFRNNGSESQIATIVIRGATANVMDDIERAIDDGVNVFKALTKDPRMVAGAGAVEMELARQVASYAEETPGLDQYAIRRYAVSFECVPRIIAEGSGHIGSDVISSLYAAHQAGKVNAGVSVEENPEPIDALELSIFDSLSAKHWAIKLASDAVLNILLVDQIIMAKQAGGPKVRESAARDDD